MGHQTGAEIVFFDVETTIPTLPGQGYAILEFAAMLVCPMKLKELHNYSTLVRPAHPSLISPASVRCNGITRDDVASAPTFADIADTVYELLHERVWAGHNISRFDCIRLREAFTEINRPPPEHKGIIDSLPLLTRTFGRSRAGNMKMATLAEYFELGQQKHRSLDDVRMNLEVIKYCATVLFLESNFPAALKGNNGISSNTPTRNRSDEKSLLDRGRGSSSSNMKRKSISQAATSQHNNEEKSPTSSSPTDEICCSSVVDNNLAQQQYFGFPPQMSSSAASLSDEASQICTSKPYDSNTGSCLPDIIIVDSCVSPDDVAAGSCSMGIKSLRDKKTESMSLLSAGTNQCNEEKHPTSSIAGSELKTVVDNNLVQRQLFGHPQPQILSSQAALSSEASSSSSTFAFLKPHEIFVFGLTATLVSSYYGSQRIRLLHNGFPFQISCADLRIRYGIKGKFCNNAGQPKLNFVVHAPQSLCEVLKYCDAVALSLFLRSGGISAWKPVVIEKEGFCTVRLQIPPTSKCGEADVFSTEVYKKEKSSGIVQRLLFNKADIKELRSLWMPGSLVDAIFSLDHYEYQQSDAGIRLVAKKLIIN